MNDSIAAPERNMSAEHTQAGEHVQAEALKLLESKTGGAKDTASEHLPSLRIENSHITGVKNHSGNQPEHLNPSESPKLIPQDTAKNSTDASKGDSPNPSSPVHNKGGADRPDDVAKPLQKNGSESQPIDANFVRDAAAALRALQDPRVPEQKSDVAPGTPNSDKFDASPGYNMSKQSLDRPYTINLDGTISQGKKKVEPIDTWQVTPQPEQPATPPAN